VPLLQRLQQGCRVATAALDAIMAGETPSEEWRDESLAVLDAVGEAHGPVEIALVRPFRLLVHASLMQAERELMPSREWLRRVEQAMRGEAVEPKLPPTD
jgi:hypothetical protein